MIVTMVQVLGKLFRGSHFGNHVRLLADGTRSFIFLVFSFFQRGPMVGQAGGVVFVMTGRIARVGNAFANFVWFGTQDAAGDGSQL